MTDALQEIKSLPDISFIDGLELEDLQEMLFTWFQDKLEEITGESVKLQRADPCRVILLAAAQYFYQGLLYVDRGAKMNLLKYSYGDYLKHLAAFKNTLPLEPKKAVAEVKWSLEQARQSATPIQAGTRITADWKTFFETSEYAEIPAGETEIILTMTCTETGTKGNGFAPGELHEMVDPRPFIASVANITTSAGGTDEESDESLAERAYLAPEGYSTAGPEGSYLYHAREYDPEIGDVLATSPSPGVCDIRFIMDDGSLPSSGEIAGLEAYLSSEERRPLTDNVQVGAPEAVSYQINMTYYINRSSQSSASAIQGAVESAVDEYRTWQRQKIGRDINPDELLGRLKAAGIKRAVITNPAYTVLSSGQVAKCTSVSVTYGGLEDD